MKSRFIYRAWKTRFRDQKLEIATALSLVGSGDVVVDAGAHKGSYLYWLRKKVGSGGKVHAFEPQAFLAQYLRRMTEAFSWQNVKIHETALSSARGRQPLYLPDGKQSPGATLSDREEWPSILCHTERMDDLLDNEGPVRFLKVDVEGHELELFRGAEKVLRRDHPALLFECEIRHAGKAKMEELFGYLLRLGYRGQFFCADRLEPVEKFRAEVHQAQTGARFWDAADYCNNFLFLSP